MLKSTIHFLVASLFVLQANGQAQYEIQTDPKHPKEHILRGIINKYLVQNDGSYNWYTQSQTGYKPDSATLNAFEAARKKVQFVVFGGTWCEDTQAVLPKFFRLLEMTGVEDTVVSFFGVNRDKKTIGSIADAFNIKNVPTIIVMKEGKEIGRVVEYGKTGRWDKELAEIVKL